MLYAEHLMSGPAWLQVYLNFDLKVFHYIIQKNRIQGPYIQPFIYPVQPDNKLT